MQSVVCLEKMAEGYMLCVCECVHVHVVWRGLLVRHLHGPRKKEFCNIKLPELVIIIWGEGKF